MKRGHRRTAVTLLAGLTALTVFSQTIFATEPAERRIPDMTAETLTEDHPAVPVPASSSAAGDPSGRSEEGTAWHAEDGTSAEKETERASEYAEGNRAQGETSGSSGTVSGKAGNGGWASGLVQNITSVFESFITWVKGAGRYLDEEDAYRDYFGTASGFDASGRSTDPDGQTRATSPDAARLLRASASDAYGRRASASNASGRHASASDAGRDEPATPADAFPEEGPVFSEKGLLAALLMGLRRGPEDDSTYPMLKREYQEVGGPLWYLYYAWAESLNETFVTGCELQLKNEAPEPDPPGTVDMYLYDASQDDPFCEDEPVAYTKMDCVKALPDSTEMQFRTDEDGDLYWYYMTEEGLEALERQDDKTFRISVSPEEEGTVNVHRIPVGIIEDPDLITVDQVGGAHIATETELRKVEVYVNDLLIKSIEVFFPVDGHRSINPENQLDVWNVSDEYFYGEDYSYDRVQKIYEIRLWNYRYSLKYSPNGGTGTFERQYYPDANGFTTDRRHTFTITTQTPERDGYTFLGWAETQKAKKAKYQPGGTITLEYRNGSAGNTGERVGTLYAVWKRSTCTVSYAYTGTVPENAPPLPESQTVAYGAIVSPAPAPSMTGYTFSGWSIDRDFMVETDTVITGSWTIITHTVTRMVRCDDLPEPFSLYEAEGLENPQTLVYGAEIPKTAASKENYDFDGWYTDPELTAQLPENAVITDEDVMLYGLFRRKRAPLEIRKTGLEDGESAIFTLTGPGLEQGLRIVVPGGDAVTVAGLPVGGTFVIAEDSAWSCRYVPAESREVTIPEEGAGADFHNAPDSRKNGWFFGETAVRNLFHGGESG